jgi:serine/threonine protein kinase
MSELTPPCWHTVPAPNGSNADALLCCAVPCYMQMAPELLLGRQCTSSVDIYSFGVLLWELSTGGPPSRSILHWQPLQLHPICSSAPKS